MREYGKSDENINITYLLFEDMDGGSSYIQKNIVDRIQTGNCENCVGDSIDAVLSTILNNDHSSKEQVLQDINYVISQLEIFKNNVEHY